MLDQHKNYCGKINEYKQALNTSLQNDGTVSGQDNTKLEQLQNDLNLDNRGVALAYSGLGLEKLYSDPDVAKGLFQMAIRLYEKTPAAHAGYGYILYSNRDRKDAIKELERAKKLFEEQNMIQEVNQIDEFLREIAKNDNWWKQLTTAFKLLSNSKPIHNNTNYFNNCNIGNVANQVNDNACQQANQSKAKV